MYVCVAVVVLCVLIGVGMVIREIRTVRKKVDAVMARLIGVKE